MDVEVSEYMWLEPSLWLRSFALPKPSGLWGCDASNFSWLITSVPLPSIVYAATSVIFQKQRCSNIIFIIPLLLNVWQFLSSVQWSSYAFLHSIQGPQSSSHDLHFQVQLPSSLRLAPCWITVALAFSAHLLHPDLWDFFFIECPASVLLLCLLIHTRLAEVLHTW